MVLVILLGVVGGFPAAAAAAGLGKLSGPYDSAVTTWVSVHLIGIVILALVWVLGLRRYRVSLPALGLLPVGFPSGRTGIMTVGALLASLGATSLYGYVIELLGADILVPPQPTADIAFPGPAVALTFQALAISTPLTEEIFFRGFIFAGLVPRFGFRWAIIASAAVFAAFHLAIGLLIPIFITGLLLAWLYYRTGSLWPCVVAHAGQNALVVAAQVYWV